jgi:hypothetical protein
LTNLIIAAILKELISQGKMFPVAITEKFYDIKIPVEARAPWYIFVYKFLVCVNGDLLKNISGAQAKEQKNIFNYITISDEAFARWVLEIRYLKVVQDMNNIIGKKPVFQKPTGQHDSNKYSSRYNEIHRFVREGREVTKNRWNDLFWYYFKIQNKILFVEKSIISHENMAASKRNEKPLEDEAYKASQIPVESTKPFVDEEMGEDAIINSIDV